jgi:ribonucleoside-diphosphate reductase alpha chain
MSEYEDYEFAGTNPCGEVPLVAGGTCLLGSINLSEFVTDPFTDKAKADLDGIEKAVRIAVRGLNEVLDEGEDLHPLQSQRDAVRDYRQIGLGVMGFADMLIKLGIKYGSYDCLTLINTIGFIFSDRAISESSRIAVDNGSFKKFDIDKVLSSKYIKYATSDETKEEIRKNGLRNSQILAIAPTGTLSTLLGVSGGAEPIFATKFKRKTESVHNEDVYYDVYTPIVKEIIDRSGAIPDYVVTSHDVSWKERIDVQAYWQTFIDSAISSTVNLPNSITPKEVGELFKTAWDSGLKGVTIFRDGCKRAGILTVDDPDNEKDEVEEVEQSSDKYQVCSECGEKIEVIQNGCTICMNCGHSPC